jgi:DNA-binding NarL/FixJ family response regulator/signal transduction histidine kinase
MSMSGFYFNQYALSHLALFILTLVMTVYLLRLKEKNAASWLFTLFFVAITGFAAVSILEATAVWSRRFYAVHLQLVVASLALVAILQFAYHFPQAQVGQRREARIVLLLSLLATALAAGWAVYQFSQLNAQGEPRTDTRATEIWLALGFLWLITVFWRRSYALSRREAPEHSWWQHLWRPQGRPAQAAFAFVLAFLLAVGLTGLVALTNWIPPRTVRLRNNLVSAGVLLNLFIIAVIYFNYTPQRTSLMAKLVGISLVAILLILGLVGTAIVPSYSLPLPDNTTTAQTIRFVPQADGSYSVTSLPLQLVTGSRDLLSTNEPQRLPFAFPFFGRTWQQVEFRQVGVLVFGPFSRWAYEYNWQPAIMATYYTWSKVAHLRYVHMLPDKYAVTWVMATEPPMTTQIVLYRDGRIDLNYQGITFDAENRFGLQSGDGGSDFAPFDPTATYSGERISTPGALAHFPVQYRQYLDEQLRPLVYLTILASLLIVLGFPLFFRHTLVTPLNNLVRGVTAVNKGDLQVQVPVQSQDEIGYVTQAFNHMVQSVSEADQHLEAQVKERTEALIASERQVVALAEREQIGRDLHDDLGQVLGYLNIQAEVAHDLLAQGQSEQAQTTLADLRTAAQLAQHSLRQYILGVRQDTEQPRPAPGFAGKLNDLLSHLQQRYNLDVHLSLPDDFQPNILAAEVEEQLLRVIQEALTNVGKHAGVSTAQVLFTLHPDEVQVIITDEGKGFTPSENPKSQIPITNYKLQITPPPSPSFGLAIMRERVQQVGGSLELRSAPGRGTRVIIRVPRSVELAAEEAIKGARILLVDDHQLYLEGIQNLLWTRGMTVIGLAHDGLQAQELAGQLQPDLILMDLDMPVCDGLEATREIKARWPQIKIVMLTVAADEEKLFTALRYGASGYLLKSMDGAQFFQMLADVMRGETVLSPALAARVLTNFAHTDVTTAPVMERPAAADQATTLTYRQQEVLELVAQGYSNKEIAVRLNLTERTIKHHVGQILERFQLKSRYELAGRDLTGLQTSLQKPVRSE